MTESSARVLCWLLLLNAVLMASIVERYTALKRSWSEHQMAIESYVLLHEDQFP